MSRNHWRSPRDPAVYAPNVGSKALAPRAGQADYERQGQSQADIDVDTLDEAPPPDEADHGRDVERGAGGYQGMKNDAVSQWASRSIRSNG